MIFVLSNICIDSVHSEWFNIHCVQLIVFVEYIINIVLIPAWNIDDDVQITLLWLSRYISLQYGFTSPVVIDKM